MDINTQMHRTEGLTEPSIALISSDGALVDWNERFAAEFHGDAGALAIGDDFLAMIAATVDPAAASACLEGFGRARTYRYRSGLQRIEVQESRTAQGNILRVAHCHDDPRARELQQRLVRAASSDPDELAALRRRAREEILRAKEASEAANSAKSRFVSTVSHELRTPMQGILGMTGLLLDTEMSDTQREYLGAIDKSGRILLALIDDILEVSQIDHGQLSLRIEAIDVVELVEGVALLLAPRAHEKGLGVTISIEPRVPRVIRCDGIRLRQVLLSLVGNALKFSGRGPIRIGLGLAPRAGAAGPTTMLRFEVEDHGVGVDRARAAEIFENFGPPGPERGERGLAIAKRLVELHGGAIGVDSEVGVGATFWFEVPALTGAAPPIVADLRGLRALLVEDNEINQAVLEAYLASAEVPSVIVGDGASAVDRCRDADFDVILMDIHLPDIDGYEVTRRIRAETAEGGPRPWIIAVSADTRQRLTARAASAGIDAQLTKPVLRDELLATIARLTGRDGRRQGERGRDRARPHRLIRGDGSRWTWAARSGSPRSSIT